MSVSFDKNRELYTVRVQVDGVRHFGGRYETLEQAIRANKKLMKSLFGEKAPVVEEEAPPSLLYSFTYSLEETDKTPFRLNKPSKFSVAWKKLKGFLLNRYYEKELDKAIAKSKV